MTPFRPEFEEALHLWARVSQSIEDMGFPPPILVGGAAAELYSGSAIATGDFDLVTPRIDILDRAMAEHGFVRPAGVGKLSRGWVHPHLRLGFEVVGSSMLDGLAERDRAMLFEVSSGDRLVVISIEDLIADRIGQFASGTAPEMLIQAKMIFNLHKQLDMPYMDRRIRAETAGDHGIEILTTAA